MRLKRRAMASEKRCEAIIDDWEHGGYYAPMQRIHAPGDKGCSRRAVDRAGKLRLCGTHYRMCCEGLVAENGRVANRGDIANVRKYPETFPRGIFTWFTPAKK